jgi:AcrR family transcriptional regulator
MAEKRRYTSPRREEQARATRTAVLTAAAQLFTEHGYAATSMAAVAARAGVSPQTVYNTVSGKPQLLKAAYDVALAEDDEPVPLADRPEVRRLRAVTDPAELLRGYAELGTQLLRRVGPLMLQLANGAAAGEPDLVEHVRVTDAERATGTLMVVRRVQELGGLAPGLSVERARDRIWVLNSVQVWHLLVAGRGWSDGEYTAFTGDAMCAAVLG